MRTRFPEPQGSPNCFHLLYTQPGVLDDLVPTERQWGIDAGLAWRHVSAGTVVYVDHGISLGMYYGITAAKSAGKPVEFRSLNSTTNTVDNGLPNQQTLPSPERPA